MFDKIADNRFQTHMLSLSTVSQPLPICHNYDSLVYNIGISTTIYT